jgi:hypothetical protein
MCDCWFPLRAQRNYQIHAKRNEYEAENMKGMRRSSTTERPVATRKIATPYKHGPKHSQRSSRAQPRLSPQPGSKAHLSAVQRGCPFMELPPGRLAPTCWLVFQLLD